MNLQQHCLANMEHNLQDDVFIFIYTIYVCCWWSLTCVDPDPVGPELGQILPIY